MKLKHILLTTDLSAEALRPFEPVAGLARETGARVTLLHVVQDLQASPRGAPLAPPVSSPDLSKEIAHARLQIDEQRAALGEGIEVSTEVLAGQDVGTVIAGYAVENDVDLIAISTHGRKGWRRLALGSVAEQVLREAAVPVLSFHRPK